MTIFQPGKFITNFQTKDGQEGLIRYPVWGDLDLMVDFSNRLSKENVYSLFAGEYISKGEQINYLNYSFKEIEEGNNVNLFAFINNDLAGIASVRRVMVKRSRSNHVATLGISIDAKYRSLGVGFALSRAIIEEAKQKILGLKSLELDLFGQNEPAYKLYQKLGFVEVGRIPERYMRNGEYDDMVLMQLKIT